MLLFDNETNLDLLYFDSFANAICEVITEANCEPVTIGIHGDWGAGKSSVLKMIETNLSNKDNLLCLRFNGWLFQGFEDAKIALMESIIYSLLENKKFSAKLKDNLGSLIKRINWLKIIKMGGTALVNYMTGLPTPEQITSGIKLLEANNGAEKIEEAITLLKPREEIVISQEMYKFRNEFEKLLEKSSINKLVILIDDLDRCLPKTAIETLEAIRLFLLVPKTAFIIAADEKMIECCVKEHFPSLISSQGFNNYAKDYLEKLIQVPFRLPSLGATETKIYLMLSFIKECCTKEKFNEILKISKEFLQKPWENSGLQSQHIQSILGNIDSDLQEKLTFCEHIYPILSRGTNGNPRQIKRFVNTLLLRLKLAKSRNMINDIDQKVLAKLMLLEYFQSTVYKEVISIAANNNDGICKDLKLLKEGSKDLGLKIQTDEPWFINWLRMQPEIEDMDLRPYIFISKDSSTNLFANNLSENVLKMFDILLKDKIIINKNSQVIKDLTNVEASECFDLLKNKISDCKNWKSAPEGYNGLLELVLNHEFLQETFFDFVSTFDGNKVGAWILVDKDKFKPEIRQRFDLKISEWKDSNKRLRDALILAGSKEAK